MSFQDISKHLLGFFSSSPTLIDKILTQLKQVNPTLRHYVATHAVDGLLHWVKNDSGLTSREKSAKKRKT